MFVRMLKLPEAERTRHDLSSHRMAVHAAAPCPVHVKEQMIAWWGPIIDEYYAGTENIGSTAITSAEWLAHKGSVGRPSGTRWSTSATTTASELPAGEIGAVYFEGAGGHFEYHGDDEEDRRVSAIPTTRPGARWATSAGWTRRATST